MLSINFLAYGTGSELHVLRMRAIEILIFNMRSPFNLFFIDDYIFSIGLALDDCGGHPSIMETKR